MLIGYLILEFAFDFNIISDRPAMYRATLFWLFTIPMYWVSLVFLWLFYTYGHIWKKNEVSVGYEYDEDSQSPGPWEWQFEGHWVSFTNSDIDRECCAVRNENGSESDSTLNPDKQADLDQDGSAVLQETLRLEAINPPNEQDSERDSLLEQVSSS